MLLKPLYPRPKSERLPKRRAVAVCIAAIAGKNTLIGVSDRMLTAGNGDIEFEPEQGKFWPLSPSIVALIAGDSTVQGELLKQTHKQVKDWIFSDPNSWVNVNDAASLYCQKFRELRRERAEAAVLCPLGLDIQSFLANQSTMERELVGQIANRLIEWDFPEVLETIFMGIDTDGPVSDKGEKLTYPQIYVTYYDKLLCLNTVGFAAIGIGKAHADSQFTFTGHWPLKPFDETLPLAYAAKKRAEAAPGVGKSTDILVIGPNIAKTVKVEDRHLQELDRIYRKSRAASIKAVNVAQKETKSFVERVNAEKAKPKTSAEPAPSTESVKK